MKRLLTLLLVVALCGCASKVKKRTQAQAAYQMGQQRAYDQIFEARRINIRVVGPVRNPEIQWSEGLSLTQAIITANYTAAGTPQQIAIVRQQERISVDAEALLHGGDFPLEPGDTIELHP
jgi:hypothetical protein